MTGLPAIANILVGSGVTTIVVALIAGFFARPDRRSNYARTLVEASGQLADRADKRSEAFEAKLDRVTERLWKFADLLRRALPYVEPANPGLAARIEAALDSGTGPGAMDPPSAPAPTP